MEFANKKIEFAHLDLKPENILINEDERLQITDFGGAHRVNVNIGQFPKSKSGTWVYAAPEAIANKAEDSRADIYAFGVIFYEMLTGELPYPFHLSEDSEPQFKQLSTFHAGHGTTHNFNESMYWQGIPGVDSGALSWIISSCLGHLPSDRFRDFTSLRKELERELKLSPPEYAADLRRSDEDLYRWALSLHQIGYYSEALAVFNRLLQQCPGNGQFWLDAALTLIANGQVNNARGFIEHALYLDSSLAEKAQHLLNS
jgi:serine/threonine protein kinase